VKRRDFLKIVGTSIAAVSLGKSLPLFSQTSGASASANTNDQTVEETPQVVRVENGDPVTLFRTAIKEFGGMSKFVSRGDVVVVKPNIAWDRSPELAATTNPEIVAEIVKHCLEAGAKKVKVFDRTCNNPQRCYTNSQIEEKAAAMGAEVSHIREENFRSLTIKNGELLREWPIYRDYLEADKIINVPIAKHHALAGVTLGLKNLMGVMGGNRGEIHAPIFKKLLDIGSEILPTLTIIDAFRILTRHGPQGGNPNDVKLTKTMVVSPCTISADYATLDLFGLTVDDVPYIKEAIRRGMNKFPAASLKIKKISLS